MTTNRKQRYIFFLPDTNSTENIFFVTDSFLRSRTSTDHEATAMVKTQFMSFWDGLMTDPNCCVMIMGATNRARDVDAAILRRMPSRFHIDMPVSQTYFKFTSSIFLFEI